MKYLKCLLTEVFSRSFQNCIAMDNIWSPELSGQWSTNGKNYEQSWNLHSGHRVSLSLWRNIILKAPVVSNMALFFFSPAQACIPSPWFGLSYLAFLFPLVLKQAVYCVCSVEQPALKALCVCVFVPASLSDCVNPLEALVTSSLPCPLFFSTTASIG